MKKQISILLMLSFCGTILAQDTIFVKNGDRIPAVILSKDDTELRYKKFGQPEPAAIYSVFISDIKSIHYSDGIIADYTKTGNTADLPKTALELANTMGIAKLSIGTSYTHFKRDGNDEMQRFWKYQNGGNSPEIISNPVYFPIEIRVNMVLGQSRRNWLGTGLELIFTPSDALSSSNTTGSNQFKFRSWYYNIPLYYGHSLNHKKTLIAILEPALDLSFMSGYIKLNNVEYELASNFGTGMNIGIGIDWILSKRFLASVRAGQRYTKVKESHKDESSSTGYKSFYVNKTVNDDLLIIRYNGPYVSAGLSWCMYYKMKGFRPE